MTFGIGVVLLHVLFDGIRAVLQMFRSMLHICAHFIFLVGTALSPQQQVKDISSEKKVKACMHDENYRGPPIYVNHHIYITFRNFKENILLSKYFVTVSGPFTLLLNIFTSQQIPANIFGI